ncbi:MAG: hypothetical protein ISN29_00185 [Gammaproteobacteria bacterium AqS3]|nr:hypothetical protein [Gammaproteobacteria bacterium AqS3]
MAYLLDTSVFIQIKNPQHGFDFCPALAGAESIQPNIEKLARIAKTLPIGRQCKAGAQFKALRG